ncbi:MAG: nucleotidyltransferase domain-containing protein [Acidimicrobiia bacterium]|nr:nucleotidyltransferase domain-containing protein [Acidimicrobiia bacterium]
MATTYGERIGDSIIALAQRPEGMRLREVADALDAPLSSAQRAIGSLIEDELVLASAEQPPRYATNTEHPAVDALVEFSLRAASVERAMDVVLRVNRAVQFAGSDADGYLVVLSPFAEPADVARLGSSLERINRLRPDSVPFEIVERGDLKRALLESLTLRERGLRMTAVKGSAARVFRNPHEHGSFGAPRLGRLHPSLPGVSRRTLQQLAEEHGLARVRAFGSAVRGDFRPDSDIDLMIEPAPGTRLRLSNLVDIRERLEGLFDRDVDLVNTRVMNDSTLRRALDEGVTLYERSGS